MKFCMLTFRGTHTGCTSLEPNSESKKCNKFKQQQQQHLEEEEEEEREVRRDEREKKTTINSRRKLLQDNVLFVCLQNARDKEKRLKTIKNNH